MTNPIIYTIASEKGGVGKTTTTINLAHEFALDGKRTLVVDATVKQSHIFKWVEKREDKPLFSTFKMGSKYVHRELPEIAKDFDIVLIDTPAGVPDVARSCLLIADIALVPCTPSEWDEDDTIDTFKLIEQANEMRESVAKQYKLPLKTCKFGAFLSKYIVGTTMSKEVLVRAKAAGFKIFDAKIANRTICQSIPSSGKTIQELQSDCNADREIKALYQELKEFTHG